MQSEAAFPASQRWYHQLIDVRRPWLWLAYLPLFGMTWFYHPPPLRDLAVSVAGLCVFLALYIYGARCSGRAVILPAILIFLLALALIPFGGNWSVLSVYACAVAAELRPARDAVRIVATFITISVAALILQGAPWYAVAMAALFQTMVVYSKMAGTALGDKHRALLKAQEEVRLLAQEAERERIARDLHDLLGRTLTLIALKSDLAARLIASDPQGAAREMREAGEAARGGLTEVRATVDGISTAGLGREIEASRAALATAGLDCAVKGEDIAIPAANGAVLAMALREAVTNVIRHAGATHCDIVLAQDDHDVRLTVSDNGQGGRFDEGSGLRGMRARLSAAGGSLQVRAGSGGTEVTAAIPVAAAA